MLGCNLVQSCMKLITIHVTIIKQLHTLTINKRGSVSMSKDCNILEISVKSSCLSPCLWASFHSLTPLLVVSVKEGNCIKSQYELLKLSILCTRFERNYSSCTGRSSENLCSSSGAAQVKERRDETQKTINFDGFLSFITTTPLNANVLFGRYFFNLTLCMTKLRVLVLSFPDFTDISIG